MTVSITEAHTGMTEINKWKEENLTFTVLLQISLLKGRLKLLLLERMSSRYLIAATGITVELQIVCVLFLSFFFGLKYFKI